MEQAASKDEAERLRSGARRPLLGLRFSPFCVVRLVDVFDLLKMAVDDCFCFKLKVDRLASRLGIGMSRPYVSPTS